MPVDLEQQRELESLDVDGLERLREHLKVERAWPARSNELPRQVG